MNLCLSNNPVQAPAITTNPVKQLQLVEVEPES